MPHGFLPLTGTRNFAGACCRSQLLMYFNPSSCQKLPRMRTARRVSKTNSFHTSSDEIVCAIDRLRLHDLRQRFSEHQNRTAASADPVVSRWKRVANEDKTKNFRSAAVLVPLCYRSQKPSLIFTARAHTLRTHRGEISFPGGGADDQDADAADTALRETEEETGLPRSGFQVWGECFALPNKALTHYVCPVIAAWNPETDFAVHKFLFNADEVAEVFVVPLSHLCMPANQGYTQFRRSRGLFVMPVFRFMDYKIWGLTAMITHQVLTILLPDYYKLKLKVPELL